MEALANHPSVEIKVYIALTIIHQSELHAHNSFSPKTKKSSKTEYKGISNRGQCTSHILRMPRSVLSSSMHHPHSFCICCSVSTFSRVVSPYASALFIGRGRPTHSPVSASEKGHPLLRITPAALGCGCGNGRAWALGLLMRTRASHPWPHPQICILPAPPQAASHATSIHHPGELAIFPRRLELTALRAPPHPELDAASSS
jgi:hypothetical protein